MQKYFMITQMHVYIKGQVVGIGYRAWTILLANQYNVTGWVRNVYDNPKKFGPFGGVEAVFQADKKTLLLIKKALNHGPQAASVTEVETYFEEIKKRLMGFEIKG
jgi:acylphosphatase